MKFMVCQLQWARRVYRSFFEIGKSMHFTLFAKGSNAHGLCAPRSTLPRRSLITTLVGSVKRISAKEDSFEHGTFSRTADGSGCLLCRENDSNYRRSWAGIVAWQTCSMPKLIWKDGTNSATVAPAATASPAPRAQVPSQIPVEARSV